MRTYFVVGLLLLYGSLLATAVPVSGRLLAADGQALAYATASVYTDSVLIDGTVTGEDGTFSLELEPGEYRFVFEFIGYGRLVENRTISEPTLLGDLILQLDAVRVETVEVRAQRTTVSLQLDKKVYNIGQDALARGGTVAEILDQLPAISVSVDGDISLRGDGAVKVLIDGRPSALAESGGLVSLSAQSIERVEIITNPSSRYEASGSAGIINIILKKNPDYGYGATLGITAGLPTDYRTNLNLNYRREKWKVYGTGGVQYTDYRGRSKLFRKQDGAPRYALLDQRSESNSHEKTRNAYLGFDYQLTKRTTVTASYSYNAVNNDDGGVSDYQYSDSTGSVTESWSQQSSYTEPYRYGQVELSLNTNFAREGSKLTWAFQRDRLRQPKTSSVSTDQLSPTVENVTRYVITNDEVGSDLLLQGDYVHIISDKAKLETGLRADRRVVGADYFVDVAPTLANSFTYTERIGAGYGQYAYEGETIGFQVGLRYEYTEQQLDYVASPENDYLRVYPRLFPSFNLSYKFTEATQGQLSLSRRIWRPQSAQLNPFPTITSPTQYQVGNPELQPVISDRLEVNALTKTDKWTISTAVYVGIVRDFQFYVNERVEENLFGLETGTIISRPINLDDEYRLGTDISVDYRPTETLTFGLDVNGFAYEQTGRYRGEDLGFSRAVAYAGLRTEATLPANIEFTARLGVQSPYRTIQIYWWSKPTLTAALSRKMGERVTLTANVRSAGAYQNEVFRPDFTAEGSGRWSRWRGRMTVQYRLQRGEG